MRSKAYQWTSEQQEFLDAYQAECGRWLDEYKRSNNPEDPIRIRWSRDWEMERMEALGGEYRKYLDGWKRCEPGYTEVVREGAFRIAGRAEDAMREYYNTLVNAYQLPEPPKDIQHDKAIKVKCWKYAKQPGCDQKYYDESVPYQSVLLVGQIIIQPILWNGTKTWEFSEAYGTRKLPIKLEVSGSREIKKAYEERAIRIATELSKLMDWEVVDSIPSVGMRLLRNKIREIEEGVM